MRLSAGLLACQAVGHVASALLGPCSTDALILRQDGSLCVSNDGATALAALPLPHPLPRLLLSLSMATDDAAGDGTTSVVVIACALLRHTENLLARRVARRAITQHLLRASEVACEAVAVLAATSRHQSPSSPALLSVVSSALRSKAVSWAASMVAPPLMQAASAVAGAAADSRARAERIGIVCEREGSSVSACFLPGLLLPCPAPLAVLGIKPPLRLVVITAPIANAPIGLSSLSATDNESALKHAAAALRHADDRAAALAHVLRDAGVDIVASAIALPDPLIPVHVRLALRRCGIFVLDPVPQTVLHRLAHASGARPLDLAFVSRSDPRASSSAVAASIGTISMLQPVLDAETGACCVAHVPGEATIVIASATPIMAAETRRALWDALRVACDCVCATEAAVVPGAAACEAQAAAALEQAAAETDAVAAAVFRAAAQAVLEIPRVLMRSAGCDADACVRQLMQQPGQLAFDAPARCVRPVFPAASELLRSKQSVYRLAFEAAATILRVDEILDSHV